MASSSRARTKNPNTSPMAELLKNEEHRERYEHFFQFRKVIPSKYLYLDYFERKNMPFTDCLGNLGLKNFVKYKGFWSEEVVRAFYTSFEYNSKDRLFTAEVRGTKILIDEKKFAEIIGIPPPSEDDLCFNDNYHSISSYNREDTYKTINREDDFSGYKINIADMNANDRMLLNVITHIFVNKPGNWAGGSECEFFIMACILNGTCFNIPYFIMQRMASCVAKRKSPLPFASIVSKIVKHCGIDYRFNVFKVATCINKHSLKRMNFELVDNEWRRAPENLTMKRAQERRELTVGVRGEGTGEEEAEEQAQEEAEPVGVTSTFTDQSSRMLNDLLNNSNQMLTMMASMDTRLANLENASSDQASEIQQIKEMIRDIHGRR